MPKLTDFQFLLLVHAAGRESGSLYTLPETLTAQPARTRTTAPASGTQLVRAWGDKAHVVTIGEDHTIQWDGRPCSSGSATTATSSTGNDS